jgi:hypothetical protein
MTNDNKTSANPSRPQELFQNPIRSHPEKTCEGFQKKKKKKKKKLNQQHLF